MKKIILFLFIFSCKGFYEPITLDMRTPEGPAPFKAGWRDGCRSALSAKGFANAFVYNVGYGTGAYHNDLAYINSWPKGYFSCAMHTGNFVAAHSMQFGPLQ